MRPSSKALIAHGAMFVVGPALRVFDTPENRSLVWVMQELERVLRQAPREASFG